MSALAKQDEHHEVQTQSQGGAMLERIMQAASNAEMDIDKFERLIALQRDMEKEQAKKEFYAAMSEAQNAMKPIVKNAENSFTGSKYATLEAINREIQPIIYAHGFSITFGEGETQKNNHYRVQATIRHVSGHSETEFMDVPSDGAGAQGGKNKNATQAFGSSVTYARRYLTTAIFNLSITGEDDDAQRASENPPKFERLTPHRAKEIINFHAILKEIDEGQFKKLKNLEAELQGRLAFMPENWIGQFMERIETRREELEAMAEKIDMADRGNPEAYQ